MNMRLILITFVACICIDICNAESPKLTATSPTFWAIGINPTNQKVISVTFDQPMRSGFSSWLGRSSVAPSSDAAPVESENHLTFSLPVGLQAGKVYVFALNEKGIPGVGFQNEKGLTLPPTFLVFQTTGNPPPDEAPPRVVSTLPANGAQTLDSTKLKSVAVNFDKPMQSAKHGLHMRENGKDIDLAKARFQYSPDGKSFTLAYDFKPSSKYEFVLNSVQDIGFATVKRIPLWPVQFAFTTA